MNLSKQLKTRVDKKFKNYDMADPDIMEDYEQEMSDAILIDQAVMQASGELLKFNDSEGRVTELVVKTLMPYYSEIAQKKIGFLPLETLYALCFFSDIVQFSGDSLFE